MINGKDLNLWKKNGEMYLALLRALEKKYKEGKIAKRKKEKIESTLFAMWDKSHEELNPFIKDNSLLREISMSFLKNSDLIYVFHV